MKRLSDQELETLLDDMESDRVERKETFKGDVPKKARHQDYDVTDQLKMAILCPSLKLTKARCYAR